MGTLVDIDADPGLLSRAAAGDTDAQAELYRRLAGPAFALTRRLVPDRAAAEDLFQDGLMKVFASLGQYRGDAPFGAWVRQILVRQCLMHLRSPWQRARLAWTSDDLAGSVAPANAEALDVERALERLGAETRAVLWLHDVEGLTHQEIGAALGRTASFSKSQLSRGHARLRRWLEGEGTACTPAPDPAP